MYQTDVNMACDIKSKGLLQFITAYKRHKERENDPFYFGEEIEYMIVKFNTEQERVDISRKSLQVLEQLWQNPRNRSVWQPEYASYMIESSPETPYNELLINPEEIEQSMIKRREDVNSLLAEHEHLLTITSFPRLGNVKDESNSIIIHPNDLVTDNARFKNITKGILQRLQRNIDVRVPVFSREDRKSPQDTDILKEQLGGTRHVNDDIILDSLTFGYGCCCLQVTIQAPNLQNAMFLYDQLVNICPIMLALSAATPIFNGHLADVDTRWPVLSGLPLDKKTEKTTNYEDGNGLFPRFESVHCYTSLRNQSKNDTTVDFDIATFRKLIEEGIDSGLALYTAHLFSRKPLLPEEDINDNDADISHFNYIQKTNWHSVRLKVPSVQNKCGWCVEFRPMDVQVTDFENTSYVVFVMVLARVIIEYKLDFAVPISTVGENIDRANKVDAAQRGKFCMPMNIFTEKSPKDVVTMYEEGHLLQKNGYGHSTKEQSQTRAYELYYMEDIICGSDRYIGLLPVIRHYLKTKHLECYNHYLDFIENRAKGKIPTTAHAIRNFVLNHPQYQHNCVVSELIQFDLLRLIAEHTASNRILENKYRIT